MTATLYRNGKRAKAPARKIFHLADQEAEEKYEPGAIQPIPGQYRKSGDKRVKFIKI